MAKIGVRKMFYAKYVSDGVYSDGAQFGKISSFNYTPTVSSVKDYGDDVVAEVSNEQSGGTLAIEANQLSILERAYLLGHELSDGVMVVKARPSRRTRPSRIRLLRRTSFRRPITRSARPRSSILRPQRSTG